MAIPVGSGGARGGRQRALAEINVTPLVDVMLVLLIISMLAAPMLQRGINLQLPATESASLAPPPRPRHADPPGGMLSSRRLYGGR